MSPIYVEGHELLRDRVVLVTAAAGTGIGFATAKRCAEEGAVVVISDRHERRLGEAAEQLTPLMGGVAPLAVPCDVTDEAQVQALFDAAVAEHGGIDVVVNNAGYGHFGMVEELSEADIRDQLETNLLGALWVTQAALPIMRAQRSGHINQVTSEGGVPAFPGIGAYHASKWALEGLSESLAQEVSTFGIHVTNVEPGPYATDWLDTGARHSTEQPDYATVRAGITHDWDTADPTATRTAILQVVDADHPPLRVFFGRSLEPVTQEYRQRLATWNEWQPVSLAAFG